MSSASLKRAAVREFPTVKNSLPMRYKTSAERETKKDE
ncbi:MAG: hypothetical protein K0Q48_1419 [Bacillota bacterium]|jgi:hypothetical protein|nr:hypothetical protein [Bacillota bacterium]